MRVLGVFENWAGKCTLNTPPPQWGLVLILKDQLPLLWRQERQMVGLDKQ